MITRIEIDGFKSFYDFAVDLQPFTVLIGANGSGKSNLFDAIMLLSRLAEGKTVAEALRGDGRSDPREAFSLLPNGERAEKIRMAVEMLVPSEAIDRHGDKRALVTTRLRYELSIGRYGSGGLEQYNAVDEGMDAVLREEDVARSRSWLRSAVYVDDFDEAMIIDGSFPVPIVATGPTHRDDQSSLVAVVNELQSWRTIYFQPSALRAPSYIDEKAGLAQDGAHLAALLWRLSKHDERALANISLELSNVVDGLRAVKVGPLPPDKYEIKVETRDGQTLSTRQLSDGTLRFIAYLALKYDREHQGVLCIEEPENGVHPRQLERIVRVLKATATDFNSEDDTKRPLRQVIISTHSTALMAQVPLDSLVYMYRGRRNPPRTYAAPVVQTGEIKNAEQAGVASFTIDSVRQLLEGDLTDEQLARLLEYRGELRPQLVRAKHEPVS